MIRLSLVLMMMLSLSSANAAVKKKAAKASLDRVVITLHKPAMYNVQWKTLRLSKVSETQPGSIRYIGINGQSKVKQVPSGLAVAIENDALKMIWDLKYQLPGKKDQKCIPIAEVALPGSKEQITICEQSIRQFGQSADLVQKLNSLQKSI